MQYDDVVAINIPGDGNALGDESSGEKVNHPTSLETLSQRDLKKANKLKAASQPKINWDVKMKDMKR